MKLKLFYTLLFSLNVLFAIQAQTTYYCDPVNGNNSNNGSQASPFSSFGSVNWASVGLQDNDIVYLLDGLHGEGYIGNLTFSTNLLIKSFNPQQAVLTKIQINNSNHITFENIKFDASTGSFSKEEPIVVGNNNTNYITFNNCLIQSANNASTWTKTDWYNNSASGVQFRGGNITLNNNTFLNLYHAVELRGDNTLMQNNLIENFAGDAIRGLGSNSTYEHNIIKNCFIEDYAINHDDAFQAYKLSGDHIISNVIFRYNKINIFENPSQFVIDNNLIGDSMQAVIITDGSAEGWIIENNLIINNHYHGISLYGAQNCRIQNNTVVQSPLYTDTDQIPRIFIDDQDKTGQIRANMNNIIRNNICAQYTPWTYDATSVVENNIDINQNDFANYSNHFLDYSNNDFHLKASSPSVDFGANTNATNVDLDGNNRIYNNNIIDAGCYEFQGNSEATAEDTYGINPSGDGIVSKPESYTGTNPWLSGNGTGSPSELTLKIGGSAANGNGVTTSAILPFQLPERPAGKEVVEANLKVNVHYVREWIDSNIDLYGLPYSANNTLNPLNHYDDVYTSSHDSDVAIQNDYITRIENTGTAHTPDREVLSSSEGQTALVNYINAQYDAGAVAGDYIFLRLNIDTPINQSSPTSMPTAAAHYYGISDESTGVNAPLLTIKISESLSVINEIDNEQLLIYPNPTNDGKIIIKGNLVQQKTILEIYSLTGQLVFKEEVQALESKEISILLHLNSGIYVLKLSNKSGTHTQKLIIK
ncbi:T9SS type A sorting domain-containing protein [Polaribacter sp. MSW13]|uniref:T9SS type A sorting domain-containing protein n=1 Tax=Polaribacter marinus TaxID=2916838 RepID=A0A9X2AM07_9FLAO|nr:T9SS type A sorting domain-containing protein [Polaribacter marinus]MCI2229845.1 T9SS type A sorting domain-containing protein [Polaribacter marinus]